MAKQRARERGGELPSRSMLASSLIATLIAMPAAAASPQRARLAQPIPKPAVTAIIDEFKSHRLVAIGEMHRNEQVHALIRNLLQDPRFLPDGGDLVVEFGNARYQGLVDRFTAGESIPSEDLVKVWRETVNILVWDAPVYERVFTTVRTVNQSRSPAHRLRVVLADPPIDWNTITDRSTWERVAQTRDRHAAEVIEREVLLPGHDGLLIFGSGHVQNEKAFDPNGPPNLAELLQRVHPGVTLFITADWMTRELDRRLARWRPPAMARVKGTWLGDAHVGPAQEGPRFEDLVDAFLYLGPTATLTVSMPWPEIYRDTSYLRELIRRDALQGGANAVELRQLSAKFLPRYR